MSDDEPNRVMTYMWFIIMLLCGVVYALGQIRDTLNQILVKL